MLCHTTPFNSAKIETPKTIKIQQILYGERNLSYMYKNTTQISDPKHALNIHVRTK